jgi:hypothetical protein
MNDSVSKSITILGGCVLVGLVALGWLLGHAALEVKALERTVVVKGLSEREVPADIAIWPLTFQEANADLNGIFEAIQRKNTLVTEFLVGHGIPKEEITIAPPSVTDLYAQSYGDKSHILYRYTGSSTVTVYSSKVDAVRAAMQDVIALGKKGVALSGEGYQGQTQFVFSGLSALKPDMIEEATRNARSVAEKFAADSESQLGRIRSAQQGQFSIENRDSTTSHIKRVRVVSTVEYYLAD